MGTVPYLTEEERIAMRMAEQPGLGRLQALREIQSERYMRLRAKERRTQPCSREHSGKLERRAGVGENPRRAETRHPESE